MIRHVVLVRLRAGVTEPEIAAAFAEIKALEGDLPGLRTVMYGRSESPERIERGYLHGMVADFDDWAALHRYHADPRHQDAGRKLVAAAEGGLDGILVFDLEAPG
jgi:hypothetical protein